MSKARRARSSTIEARPERDDLRVNACLSGLAPDEATAVVNGSHLVYLRVDAQVYRPNEPISEVYFPLHCVLSVVTRMQDGNMIEVGTIGREGNSAIPLLLGATTTANECYCQVPGSAIRMSAQLFAQLQTGASFNAVLDRFLQAYVNMLGQLAACNRLHTIYQRCARWLLMTHDRVGKPQFELTQEYLAMMLGTQRSGVTIAAATLQKAGFISYGRGVITVLDRDGLEQAACECNEVARNQFAGILSPPGPVTYR